MTFATIRFSLPSIGDSGSLETLDFDFRLLFGGSLIVPDSCTKVKAAGFSKVGEDSERCETEGCLLCLVFRQSSF